MGVLARLRALNWRLIGAALISVGILHICATLAMPGLATTSAYRQIATVLPANAMRVFPPLSSEAQPLPFMPPAFRYAMCRIDASKGPVVVRATLPDRGWSVSLYSPDGDSLYAATGQLGRATEVALQIVSSDERFTGLTPEALGKARADEASVTIGAREAVLVMRAAEKGLAFAARIEAELSLSSCAPVVFK